MSLVTFSWVGATHFLKASYTGLHLKLLNERLGGRRLSSSNSSLVSDALAPEGNNSSTEGGEWRYVSESRVTFNTHFMISM